MIYSDKIKDCTEYIDPCICDAWVATAIVGAGVLGAGATAYAANRASEAQTNAANTAAATSRAMYDTTRGDLSTYREAGTDATSRLRSRLSELTTPISVNPDDFLNSEQYKFLQYQGNKAVQNSAAARGLGKAGAALKGAATFESGLNSQQWQQNFNNQVTNQTNAYNRLKGLVDVGENASAQTGVLGNAAATTQANAAIGAGNAQAAGINAIGGSVGRLADNLGGYAMYRGLYGGGSSSGGSSRGTPYSGAEPFIG